MTDRLLTLAEAMAQLGVKKTKLYELINDGELETIDVSAGEPKAARRIGEKGRRPSRRVPESAITRYIARRRAGGRRVVSAP